MLIITSYSIVITMFRLLLISITIILGGRYSPSRNKNRPFECGFDPKRSARLPFSLRFFILAIVFLIFDIEVALLFPLVLGVKRLILKPALIAGIVFLLILLGGLTHE